MVRRVSSYESGVYWEAVSPSGRVIGTHKTRKAALRQLAALHAAKAERGKRKTAGEKRDPEDRTEEQRNKGDCDDVHDTTEKG